MASSLETYGTLTCRSKVRRDNGNRNAGEYEHVHCSAPTTALPLQTRKRSGASVRSLRFRMRGILVPQSCMRILQAISLQVNSGAMPDSIFRAARHRERAMECRKIAQAAQQDPQLVQSYEDLAERYEQLAQDEERPAQVYPVRTRARLY
jgi:hypothetical protein